MTEIDLQQYVNKVAVLRGISPEKVLEEIQASIDEAYEQPNAEALKVPREGAVPTVKEFLTYIIAQTGMRS